jgi:superoxide dismutase
MDYGAKAAAYVEAFMQAIDWPSVRQRLDACRR